MAVTQDELYATLDLELSWSERALPEHVRTKHVHRLHPYHGKFIPQLVEVLLDRYFRRAGTCSIRSPARGRRSCRRSSPGSTRPGAELAAFNCLLMRVKTARYDVDALGAELRDACARLDSLLGQGARAARAVPPRLVLAARRGRAVRVPRPGRRVRARATCCA